MSSVAPPRLTLVTSVDQQFASGTEKSLATAYSEHGALIYNFCRRKLDEETARDVTQEVFVAAWRSHQRFDPTRGSLRAWLMAIAKNKVIDSYRRQARRPQVVGAIDPDWSSAESATVDASITRTADRMLLAQALTELSERARTVVELSFFRQLTHNEIADTTGLPLGTVKSDIRRSLLKLRENLAENLESGDV